MARIGRREKSRQDSPDFYETHNPEILLDFPERD